MSHHKKIIATVRITNDGEVLAIWFENPYDKTDFHYIKMEDVSK